MTAQEMLDEVVAEGELNRLGYFKEPCPHCGGTGYRSTGGTVIPRCRQCKGDGQVWTQRKKKSAMETADEMIQKWKSKPEQEAPPVA